MNKEQKYATREIMRVSDLANVGLSLRECVELVKFLSISYNAISIEETTRQMKACLKALVTKK